MASKTRKLKLAREQVLEAQKFLKTSLFKWQPDYLLAEKKFADAALNFKLVGEIKLAMQFYLEAAKCAEHVSTPFTIAGYYEKAARIGLKTKDTADIVSAIGYLDKASKLFLKSGSNQEIASSLMILMAETEMAAGRTVEALGTIRKAFNVASKSSSLAMGQDTLLKCIDTMVQHKELEEALKMVQEFCDLNVKQNRPHRRYPYFLCITVLQCALGDAVAAEQSFMEHIQDDGYLQDRDCQHAEELYTAFLNHDEGKLQALQKSNAFHRLPVHIMYLARSMTIFSPDSSTKAPELPPADTSNRGGIATAPAASAMTTSSSDSTAATAAAAFATNCTAATAAAAAVPAAAAAAVSAAPPKASPNEPTAAANCTDTVVTSVGSLAAVASTTEPPPSPTQEPEEVGGELDDENNWFG